MLSHIMSYFNYWLLATYVSPLKEILSALSVHFKVNL